MDPSEPHPPVPPNLESLWVCVEARVAKAPNETQRARLREAEAILRRDLLTQDHATHLVLGMLGPNNAGKSAVFNGLVGQNLSPSRATGGATRQLLGACSQPDAIDRRRFQVRLVSPGPQGVTEVLSPGPPESLPVVAVPHVQAPFLLIDAPDFDSVMEGHAQAARDLLWVTDLAVLVVTRHSYQNLAVVEFLRDWLRAGHPYVLVYNEAASAATASAHAEVLQQSFGQPAEAVFGAPWDEEVASGRAPLLPRLLEAGHWREETLGAWLWQQLQPAAIQARAREASLATVHQRLSDWYRDFQSRESLRGKLHGVATQELEAFAHEIARSAMPMGPILDAFRRVLDQRPGVWRQGYRKGLRWAGEGVQRLSRKLAGSLRPVPKSAPEQVREAEWQALEPKLAPTMERLQQRLLSAGAAQDELWSKLLQSDLAPSRLPAIREQLQRDLETSPESWQEFSTYCEGLVEAEMADRNNEWLLQIMVDLAHLLPATVAAVIVVQTGGLMTDVAVGSMGALSSMATERLSKFLGTQTAQAARVKWAQMRGEPWRQWLWQALLPESGAAWAPPDSSQWAPIATWLDQNSAQAGSHGIRESS